MKSALLVAVMQETEGEDGGGATASNVADTSGDTPGVPPGAHLDAPAAAVTDPVEKVVIAPGKTVALVAKGGDKIPVRLRDEAHLEELRREHGADAVEVLP